ncbi:MAG: nucleotide exchange factor GrpE [Spirulinaceae cyanobacterium SM2_1_0]|nr:nucleotide exchange factor GrpE [Spirulinaceae cyanobacterium SM2_1_0]
MSVGQEGELESLESIDDGIGVSASEPLPNEADPEQQAAEQHALSQQAQVIEALQTELETLRQKLNGVSQNADSYKAQYVRIAADFDNFRKRTQKEREENERQAKRTTIAELLPVVDNFERARAQIKPATDGEMAIHKSYQGVYKNLVDSLKRLGVSAMRPEGQEFDPNYHEAMLRQPTDEYPEGTVMEQLVRGYLIGDQVLRHAMVKVAAPKEPVVASEDDGESVGNAADPAATED